MNKRIGTGLLALLMLAVLAVPAAAAKPPSTEANPGIYDLVVQDGYTVTPKTATGGDPEQKHVPGDEDTFYVNAVKLEVTVPATAGDYGLIFARSGEATDEPNEDNLVYIDQKTADAATITYDVYPKALTADVTYYLFFSTNSAAKTKVAEFKYYLPYKLGDVDENGKLTSNDALYALQAAGGKRTLSENAKLAADADKNGKLTSNDALYILQAAGGKRTL